MIPITGLYIALTALLLLFLAFKVVQLRQKYRIGLLDGGQKSISVAMRAHTNAIENAVPVLLLMLAIELNGGPAWFLHACGAGFLISRAAHAYGFFASQGKTHWGRFYGIIVNWLIILILIFFALKQVIA